MTDDINNRKLLKEYICQRKQELTIQIHEKVAIFLDTKAWVSMRKAETDGSIDDDWLLVLNELRYLVKSGYVFCPISFCTLMEVLTQEDDITRMATACLLDELSLGVAFIAPDEQASLEVEQEVQRRTNAFVDDKVLIWTKIGMTIMQEKFLDKNISITENFLNFERTFNEIWDASASKLIGGVGHFQAMNFDAATEKLNRDNVVHADQNKTFQRLLETECIGIARGAAEKTHAIARKHIDRVLLSKGLHPKVAISDKTVELAAVTNWLVDALNNVDGRRKLPSLFVHAAIHAQVRQMKKQKLKKNDLVDHHQVSQALGYCQVILVDRATRNIITANNIKLDKLYGRKVLVTAPELSNHLIELRANLSFRSL